MPDRKRGDQFRDLIPYFLHSRFFSEVFSKSFCVFFFSSAPPKSSNSSPRSSTHSPNSPPNYSPYSPNSSGNSCPHSSLSGSSRFFQLLLRSLLHIILCVCLQVGLQVFSKVLSIFASALFSKFFPKFLCKFFCILYTLYSTYSTLILQVFLPILLHCVRCALLYATLHVCFMFPSFAILLHILLQTIFKLLSWLFPSAFCLCFAWFGPQFSSFFMRSLGDVRHFSGSCFVRFGHQSCCCSAVSKAFLQVIPSIGFPSAFRSCFAWFGPQSF